jgi:hypothetical protein
MALNESHDEKTVDPMFFTEAGIVINCSGQYLKAACSIRVTDDGIVKDFMGQYIKASDPIRVM